MEINAQSLKSRIAATLQIPVERLRDEATIADVIPESFAVIEVVIDLQEELGIQLHRDDLGRVKTIGDLCTLVCERVAAMGSGRAAG